MSLDHRDGRTIRFFFLRLTNFALSLVLSKHGVNKPGFIFKGIWRWLVINLVTLIYGYSYLISLIIIVH